MVDAAPLSWTNLSDALKLAITIGRRGERVALADRFLSQCELDFHGLAGSVRVIGQSATGWTLALDHSVHASRSDRVRTVAALREQLGRAGYTLTSGGVAACGGDELYVQSTVSAEDEAWLARHCAA